MIWQVDLVRTLQDLARKPPVVSVLTLGFVTGADGMYTVMLEESKIEMNRWVDKKKRNPSEINRDAYRYAQSVYTKVCGQRDHVEALLDKDTSERRLSPTTVLKFTELYRLDHPANGNEGPIYSVKKTFEGSVRDIKPLGYAKGVFGCKEVAKQQIERYNKNVIEAGRLCQNVDNILGYASGYSYVLDTKRILFCKRLKDLELEHAKVQLDEGRKQLLLKLDA